MENEPEEIGIKCPLCGENMVDITNSIPKILRKWKKSYACSCEKVVIYIMGK